jgi:hypothetical protein
LARRQRAPINADNGQPAAREQQTFDQAMTPAQSTVCASFHHPK